MESRPRILSISFSTFVSDARVLRQLRVLAEFGDVTTIGFGPQPVLATEHIPLERALPSLPQTPMGVAKLALRQHRSVELDAPAARAALDALRDRRFDLVVANEARALPLAHAVAHGAPIWGDMHEWAPEERTNVLAWRVLVAPFMRHICATYLPQTAAITTVNASIARLYEEAFDVRVDVVRNTAGFYDLRPSNVDPDRIRLVHSGAAIPGRSLEVMIDAVIEAGDRFTLDFYLTKGRDGGKYWSELRAMAERSDRITFHDPVLPAELPETLNAYDLGVHVFRPKTKNHQFMLPNKFFDFVQARLGIILSPSVETSALINGYGLGVVADGVDAASLVAVLNTLTQADVERFKANAHVAAMELSSVTDEGVKRGIITRLLAARTAP